MDKINYEKNLIKWTSIIRGCIDSGMAVQAWCIENNVDEKKFYYWHRRTMGEEVDSLKKTKSENHTNFVQLPVPAESPINTAAFSPDMIIHIGNNRLELSNTVSEELISKVFKVMSNVK